MKKENEYQAKLIKKLKAMFPTAMIQKLDANYIQGIPDLLILFGKKWAVLECKRSRISPHQPNQDDYVEMMDSMSFARFIYPENEEEVLHDLQRSFET